MIRLTALACAALSFALPAQAMDEDQFSRLLSEAVSGVTLARAYANICAAHHPVKQAAQRDAMAGWAFRIDLDGYDRFVAGAINVLEGLAADLEKHDATLREAIAGDIDADDAMCHDLEGWLEQERFDLKSHISSLLRHADAFGIIVTEAEVEAAIPAQTEILSLGELSAQALARMEEVGSQAGAADNRDLRKAREEHMLAWLRGRGMLVAYGRVTAADEMREWRGDQQSRFMVDCLSFEPTYEEMMAEHVGKEMVVVGEPRWVREHSNGGTVALRACSLFRLENTGIALTPGNDISGLMLRPPEFDEIYAGPEAGLSIDDIDRVLYEGDFTNRMDGFGNGYTDRQEDVYVLLDDGTAYLHAWDFPFTDINVDLS